MWFLKPAYLPALIAVAVGLYYDRERLKGAKPGVP